MSQDWNKDHLADIEIFWGNQQAWKGERRQQKIRLLLLSPPSCIFTCYHHKHTDTRHKMLQLRPILVLIMVLMKASTELWSFPLLGARSGSTVWRLQCAPMCHFLECCQGWACATLEKVRDKAVFWNSDLSMEEIMLLEKKCEELPSLHVSPYCLFLEAWVGLDCFTCACA